MSFAYGIVNHNGNPESAGSSDWVSSRQAQGSYRVVFQQNLFATPPVPVVTAVANNLNASSDGLRRIVTITRLEENAGIWVMEVGAKTPDNNPTDVGFSFMLLN